MNFFARLGNVILIIAYILFVLFLVGGTYGGVLIGLVIIVIAVGINYLISGNLTLLNIDE